jgi:RNA polymerase sigma-70 factor (ECF subfamily)
MQSDAEIHLSAELLEKEESFEKLGKCLETLPVEQKESVQLFYLMKKCYKEISDLTGLEWNMVRSYIQNGRRNLKNCMEKKISSEGKIKVDLKKIKGTI